MFKINIKATNIHLSDELRDYFDKKIDRLNKFFNEQSEVIINADIGKSSEHHKSGDIFRAEIHIRAEGKEYYAVSEKEDLYSAIDDVKDEVVREMTSKRKKTLRLLRRGGAQIKNILKRLI